ncbi:MAG: hypothetical protein FJW35_00775 [Acidobacteria bacterium]|nr:hypothetical protein [Acidobacteriota bacterium]
MRFLSLHGPLALVVGWFCLGAGVCAAGAVQAPAQKSPAAQKPAEEDPFAGVKPDEPGPPEELNWLRRFTRENFAFKLEVFSQVSAGYEVEQDPPVYSRQSAGFEVLKKFSTETSTVAAFNVQFRLVRRDSYISVQNDMEGASREGFFPEYHNVYLDLYNVFNPLLGDSARSRHVGRFNLRLGRFYLPFGLNLQTDTHGTLLQLSNERNFGFERDWYAGFYGSLSRDLNYDAYYMLGSGYYPRFHGQSGLLGARLSLGNRFQNQYGIEGGVSVAAGERIAGHSAVRSRPVDAQMGESAIVPTLRLGLDTRYTRPLWSGTMALATELSGGEDAGEAVFANLHQFEYLARSRRWGWAAQYRRFWQDIEPAGSADAHSMGDKADSSLIGEVSLYLRNDISASKLHWLKLNVERTLERQQGGNAWLFTIQYYWYW